MGKALNNADFSSNNQQDAMEFVNSLLDHLAQFIPSLSQNFRHTLCESYECDICNEEVASDQPAYILNLHFSVIVYILLLKVDKNTNTESGDSLT